MKYIYILYLKNCKIIYQLLLVDAPEPLIVEDSLTPFILSDAIYKCSKLLSFIITSLKTIILICKIIINSSK